MGSPILPIVKPSAAAIAAILAALPWLIPLLGQQIGNIPRLIHSNAWQGTCI
jgi:uncharacterized membrane protein